jgi:hypothetical protein
MSPAKDDASSIEPAPVLASRRRFLGDFSTGLGGLALSWLLAREGALAGTASRTHFPAKAKRVIQVFAAGGVSHVDTFDPKPELARLDGMELTGKGKIEPFFGQPGRLRKSPFAFRPRGKSGLLVSDLLPHLASCADDIVFIRSMVAKSSNHTPATFQMNTGFTMNGFPCMGAWVSYGLGSETDDLPAFVVLPDPRGVPAGGSINWTSGFLPATHQGVAFRSSGDPISDVATPPSTAPASRAASLDLLRRMNEESLEKSPGDSTLAARIRAYELAARMQLSVPGAADLSREGEETKRLYGLYEPASAAFGRNCLLARRLLERGVRFVQIWNGGAFGSPRINWDAHEDLVENHTKQAAVMDRPVAGLLADLKRRGMLEDTLVLWTTEFGRTPFTQGIGGKGRDHHQLGFTCWMAGAGLKRGVAHGATDEVGYASVDDPVTVHDYHATALHLLGIDHTRLTFYHNGIQRRLTDVHGKVIEGVLA